MKYQSIADIYAANDSIRDRLNELLAELPDEKANTLVDGEKWTVAQIVEHLSMVEEGMSKICAKLLSKAKSDNAMASGSINLSSNFFKKSAEIAAIKVEAPEFVRPSGGRTLPESITKMQENRQRLAEIRPLFETYDGDTRKFPHPFFGDISAVEWLVLLGGHEARHINQIKGILEKIEK